MKIDNEELHAVSVVSAQSSAHANPSATEERYVAIQGTHKAIPKARLKAAGWKVTRGTRPVTEVIPDTWMDMTTGEIITKEQARKRGIKLPGVRSNSDKALALCERLARCSPSERPFVRYLLKLRNQRGGLVGPLDAILDHWIARACPAVRSTDKARKRKQLRSIVERRKLMVNDVTMAKDLQVLNPRLTKQGILEESAIRVCPIQKGVG
ncbi:hypothetical protein [Paraburkholderia phenoliruptrix]|uniref:Uncharacterized protein n=1 Tax=Paraburkholderia phenoliruptrix TaxID=252970 RepID=A0A6J5K8U6_9BURK|nr:hypothetical protein [Paraburkholderia phenoliruptrix]MDR6422411.1 hypothetical protein [Paraburkholderia phenoliruptrix]CAB4050201.1 hypothetical protein LMG9964_03866 [Paraburkholderia phenoliruptrix]